MQGLIRIFIILNLYKIGGFIGLKRLGFFPYILVKFTEIILIPFRREKHRSKDFSRILAQCLYDLGPIYIKFGQTLSTRPDIVGEEVAAGLKLLQDKLPPFSFSKVKVTIEESLGKRISDIFMEFDEEPVAAASIAQVHKARLMNGQNVAVKILRPNIHNIYERDLNLMYFIAGKIVYIFPDARRLRPMEVVKIFELTMKQELDLISEASAASEMRSNFKGDNTIVIPSPYWEYIAENVMVTEWIDGVSVYDSVAIKKAGIDAIEIATKIAIMFFNQAYRDGFFHADLHPGNILVCKDGRIALVDFGIVGRLPERDRLAVAEILHGFLTKDYKRVAQIHIDVGYVPRNTDLIAFAGACRIIGEPIVGAALKDISIAKLLSQLFKITRDFGMETQPQLLLLQKTTVVVEGIGRMMSPEINLWKLAEPWIKKWAVKNISPEAKILRLLKGLLDKALARLV
ncbi:MAG: 2-polyprenylphenol 6-hydroxylase [Pseudomonadota bacterium]|jgi:ubiquinone biosynthesis protein